LLAFVFFIPTAWAIIHIAYRSLDPIKKKALWGLFVVFVPPLGGIVYVLVHQIRKIRGKQ
jgi:hypothetical protein